MLVRRLLSGIHGSGWSNVWDLPAVYSWDAMNVAGVGEEWAPTAVVHAPKDDD